jgi:hypothetical protein
MFRGASSRGSGRPARRAGRDAKEIDMKLHFLAAGALLLGTSALAWMPSPNDAPLAGADAGWEAAATAKIEPASAMIWDQQSSTQLPGDTPDAVDTSAGNPDLDLAEAPGTESGIGGPLETADTSAALDLTPRPASANYPACHPGPGDDNCIQLYEPGVETALASWSQPTGGALGPGVQTAMADNSEASEVLAADADTAVQTAAAEPADMSQYQGMGGPEEDVASGGYPPCSATVTDRCIQLYERGVTGQGN